MDSPLLRRLVLAPALAATVMLMAAAPARAALTSSMSGTDITATSDGSASPGYAEVTARSGTTFGWGGFSGTWFSTRPIPGNVPPADRDGVPASENCFTPNATSMECKSITSLTINGGPGTDQGVVDSAYGGSAVNATFNLAGGNDHAYAAGAGSRSFDGGAGTDTFEPFFTQAGTLAEQPRESWTVDLAAGTATALAVSPDAVAGSILSSPVSLTGFENVETDTYAYDVTHRLYGDAGPNRLVGRGGADVIDGRAGNDDLQGGAGDDEMTGGPGDDLINCGPGNDLVTDAEPGDTLTACERVLALDVTLEQGALGPDVFELELGLANKGSDPLDALTALDEGGLALIFGPIAEADRADVALLAGPIPPLPGALAPNSLSEHVYALEARAPGFALASSRMRATGPDGAPHEDSAGVQIEVRYRDASRADAVALTAGGLLTALERARQRYRAASSVVTDSLLRGLRRLAPRRFRGNTPTAFERALAARLGLDDRSFAWLPNDPGEALRLYNAFEGGRRQELLNALKRGAGSTFNFALRTPFEFWSDFAFRSSAEERLKVGMELSTAASEGWHTTEGYLGAAADLLSDPGKRQAAWDAIPELADRLGTSGQEQLDRAVAGAQRRLASAGRQLKDDPESAARSFGRAYGTVEGTAAYLVLENAAGGGVVRATGAFTRARRGAASLGGVPSTGGAPGLDDLVPPGFSSLDEATAMGGLTRDQVDEIQGILADVNRSYARHGVDMALHARPTNPWSHAVDGVPKVELVPVKNNLPDDLVLGAHPRSLGKAAVYRPELPANFNTRFDAAQRQRLRARYQEKLTEYRQFTGRERNAKMIDMRRALKPGGHRYELAHGRVIEMELDTARAGDTILLNYRRLTVGGVPVVRGRPRAIKSDLDVHAVINTTTGRPPPAGIRSAIELEIFNRLRQSSLAGRIPFGFHGWTHSGHDAAASDFRGLLKYLLMYLPDDEARQVAARWGPQLGVAPDELLANLTTGQFVVRITAAGFSLGPGPAP